jgi:cell division protein FtsQ
MAVKRKISIRKVLQVFLTLVATTGCIMAMVSAARIEDNKKVTRVHVGYNNGQRYHAVQDSEIIKLAITNREIDIDHTPISKLDLHAMEQVIMADPWIASAQVFIDNDLVLHMYATQRIPVVRVFLQSGESYYLDTTLSAMPLSDNYIYYTTVVTNVPELGNDSASRKLKKDIVTLTRKIQSDTFWSVQVSQVIVDSAGMFEFVPVIGDQRIIFGDVSRMDDKFNNLFTFYKNVLNRIGWDKYQCLDVRFASQVVATPSLPYSGPVDTKVKQMNWINSIIETEARNDAKDSFKAISALQGTPSANVDSTVKKVAPAVVKPPVKPANAHPAPQVRAKKTDVVAANKGKQSAAKSGAGKVAAKPANAHVAAPANLKKPNNAPVAASGHKPNVPAANKPGNKPQTPKYTYPEKKDH